MAKVGRRGRLKQIFLECEDTCVNLSEPEIVFKKPKRNGVLGLQVGKIWRLFGYLKYRKNKRHIWS